jgi:hypothetical protein
MKAFSDVVITAFRAGNGSSFLLRREDDFKSNTYYLPYVYSKGNGVKNATACSAFQNPVG